MTGNSKLSIGTWTVALSFLAMAMAGCMAGPSDDGSSDGQGSVAFYVKDAPSDELESVFVTFSKVEVHKASGNDSEEDDEIETFSGNETAEGGNQSAPGGNQSAPGGNQSAPGGNQSAPGNHTDQADLESQGEGSEEADGADSGWVLIVNETHTVDLKAFSGDAKAFLGDADVAAGKYTQIRIHVDEAWGILAEDGSRVNMTVPSQTLKIVRPWTVEDGQETALIVDFDLEKSVIKAGQSGMWMLKPVMTLLIEKGDQPDVQERQDRQAEAESRKPDGVGNASQGQKPESPGSQGQGPGPQGQGGQNETEAAPEA